MAVHIEGAISVAEVAKVTGSTVDQVEAEALSLGIFLGEDWATRPAMSELDAYGLVTGALRRDADAAVVRHDYLAEREQWEKDGESVREAAVIESFRAAMGRGVAQPQASEMAGSAGREAQAKWEKSHPAPVMPSAAPARSWLQRIGVVR